MDRERIRKVQRHFSGPLHNIRLAWNQAVWVLNEIENGRDLHIVKDAEGSQSILGLPDPET